MGHAVRSRNLGRSASYRKATVRSLACALIERERITTTHARAKEAQRLAERLVTLGKRGTLSTRRRAISLINDPHLVRRLFSEIAPRFSERQGGYTRILHRGIRPGDGASLSVLEWVQLGEEFKPKVKKEKGKGEPREKPRQLRAAPAKPEVAPQPVTPTEVEPKKKVAPPKVVKPKKEAPKRKPKPKAEAPPQLPPKDRPHDEHEDKIYGPPSPDFGHSRIQAGWHRPGIHTVLHVPGQVKQVTPSQPGNKRQAYEHDRSIPSEDCLQRLYDLQGRTSYGPVSSKVPTREDLPGCSKLRSGSVSLKALERRRGCRSKGDNGACQR